MKKIKFEIILIAFTLLAFIAVGQMETEDQKFDSSLSAKDHGLNPVTGQRFSGN